MITRLFLFFLFMSLVGCAPRPISKRQEKVLGAFSEIMVVGKTKAERERILGKSFEILRSLDEKISHFKSTSEISRINEKGFKEPQEVSPETFFVIDRAVSFFEKSGGAFDITVLPLTKLWGFNGGEPRLPPAEEIQKILPRIGSDRLILDSRRQRVGFRVPGMEIELGGMAKGYACDQAVEFLKKDGIEAALVNIGGTIFAYGNSPEGKPWRVGLRHPRDPTRTFKVVTLRNEAVATRGDYDQFFVVNGRRYCHLLNPRTGYPANHSVAVSVIAPSALTADALSTALFVMGPSHASSLASQFPEIRWHLTYFVEGEKLRTLSSE